MYRNMLRGYAIMSLSAGLDDQRQPIRGCHFLDWPITGRKRSAQEHILWLFGGWVIYDCLQVDQVTWWPSPGDIVIRVGNGLLWNGKVEWKPHYDENPKINLTISYILFEHIPTYLYILLITYNILLQGAKLKVAKLCCFHQEQAMKILLSICTSGYSK